MPPKPPTREEVQMKALQMLEKLLSSPAEQVIEKPRARRTSNPPPPRSVEPPAAKKRRATPRLRDISVDAEKDSSARITEVNYSNGLERQQEIIDALKASKYGVMTQPELAEALGRTRGNIKHHLDNMAARGTIVRTDAKIGGHLTTVAGVDFDSLARWYKARERPNRA